MPAPASTLSRARILFFAEAVTLAHVARPVALASGLDRDLFEVHLAHHPRYRELLGELDLVEHAIDSIAPQQFMRALQNGTPLYDTRTLDAYVEADCALIARVRPDVIVGDFRLSLAVSAELTGIPYIAVSNAYWSPYCIQSYTVPDIPLTRLLGPALAQPVFSLLRPLAFALHCLPMQRLRSRHGLPGLGFDLGEVYTHADYTLYADVPQMYRMHELPANHRFIGPIVWSPAIARPHWWRDLPSGQEVVYVTLGSSGQSDLLPALVAALGRFDVTALVSTAGMPIPDSAPDNVFLAPFLPGEEAVKMASLVICNGGSPTTHQALAHGVPILGLASNLDQFLNMAAIERAGAGRCLRASRCTEERLHTAILESLGSHAMREAARRLGLRFVQHDPAIELKRIVRELGVYPERRQDALQDQPRTPP